MQCVFYVILGSLALIRNWSLYYLHSFPEKKEEKNTLLACDNDSDGSLWEN